MMRPGKKEVWGNLVDAAWSPVGSAAVIFCATDERRIYPGAEDMIARIEQAIVKIRAGDDFAAAASPYH